MDATKLCLIAFFIKIAASCDTGRIFFGSVNETHPIHLDKNGIYVQQANEFDGFPIYKHESEDLYIYHVSGTILSASFWVVGAVPGSLAVTWSIQTGAATPDVAKEKWRLWEPTRGTWLVQRHLSVTCVDESFRECGNNPVRLHGLSSWNFHQENRTGIYAVTDQMHEMRPVYRHQNSGREEPDYMYYMHGLMDDRAGWVIGPEVGQASAALFVQDYAWRPEFIVDEWVVFNGMQFQRDPKLKVSCAGNHHGNLGQHDTPFDTPDLINVEEGWLGDVPEGQSPECDASYCLHGGTCIKDETDAISCTCRTGFTGPTCENVIHCGEAPGVANGRVISQTGNSFHDMSFYSCEEDFHLMGDSAISCGENGEWGRPPTCVHWLDYLNPGVPANDQPPTRRHFRRNHRRSHQRHNN